MSKKLVMGNIKRLSSLTMSGFFRGCMINERNYPDIYASYVSKKHNISLEYINNILKEHYTLEYVNMDLVTYDNYLSERKETGSFYTPDLLSKKMISIAFDDYFENNHIYSIEDKIHTIKNMNIIDIASGTGVFFLNILEYIYDLFIKNNEEFNTLILSNIYALDIQMNPLRVLKLKVLEFFLDKDLFIDSLNINIFNEDFLLDHHKHIKYDLILSNPPYIGEKNHKELFEKYKNLEGYQGRMDLFYFFIYKGYDILASNGVLSYITTNYFITADGASNLRKFLQQTNIIRMINLDEFIAFKGLEMHNIIFNISNNTLLETKINILDKNSSINDLDNIEYTVDQDKIFSADNNIVLYRKESYFSIIDKIIAYSDNILGQLVNIHQGIITGCDRLTRKNVHQIVDGYLGEPVFVFKDKMISSDKFRPFYKSGDIERYFIKNYSKYILYIADELDENSVEMNYLYRFKEILLERREVKKNIRKWYQIQWPRKEEIFKSEKIIVPQRSKINRFAYTEKEFYSSADIYYLTGDNLINLLGILNSKLYYFYLYNCGKRKGKLLELYYKPLYNLPIAIIDIKDYVINILNKKDIKTNIDIIDKKIYNYYKLTDEEIKEVEKLWDKIN